MRTNEHQDLSPRARTWLLGSLAALSGLGYYILISMSLNPGLKLSYDVKGARYGGPLTWPSRWFHLARMSSVSRMWLFVFLMLALTAMWLAAIYLVRRDERRSTAVLIAAGFGLLALLFVFAPAFQSKDVFNYAFYGRVMTVYHLNPFLLIPHARPHDILYPLVGWKYNASVYGPVFNYLSWIVSRIARDNIAANVLGFKVMAFAGYAACLPLVYWLAKSVSPGKENMALVISAWCPILVMHILGGAHNDAIMVALVLAGHLLYRKGYLLPGIVIVLLAALVKIVAVLALAPLLVLYIRDKPGARLKRIAAAGVACISVTVLLYLPFLQTLKIFKATSDMARVYSGASVPRFFSWLYQGILRHGGMVASRAEQVADSRVHLVFLAIAAIVGILLLFSIKDFRSMSVCTAALVLVWFLTSTYILPWYLALGVMVAATTGWNLTTASLLGASAVFTLYRIPQPPRTGKYVGGPSMYMCIFFLLLLVGWLAIAGGKKLNAMRSSGEVGQSLWPPEESFPEE